MTSPAGIKIGSTTMSQSWLASVRMLVVDIAVASGAWSAAPQFGGGSAAITIGSNEIFCTLSGNAIVNPSWGNGSVTLNVQLQQKTNANGGANDLPVGSMLSQASVSQTNGGAIAFSFFLYNASNNAALGATGAIIVPTSANLTTRFKAALHIGWPGLSAL